MKAFRWYGKAGDLKLEEVPVPEIDKRDVLIEVKAAGVCGSDLHAIHACPPTLALSTLKLPITLGHEYAGIVVETGSEVRNLKKGDRVSAYYRLSCGDCIYCNRGLDNRCPQGATFGVHLDGGFADYALIPARNAFTLPEHIPFDQGAIIGCAVSTPFHALKVRGEFRPGDAVAVYGLGGIGMHAVQWAHILGARKVIGVDVMDYKLRMAEGFGADIVVNAKQEDTVEAIKDATDGLGVDVALDCVSSKETVDQMLRSVAIGGRAVSVGSQPITEIPFDLRLALMVKEVVWTGSADHTRNEHRLVISYVASGKYDLSKSITHRLPFEELNKAIRVLDEKKDNCLRVVVTG